MSRFNLIDEPWIPVRFLDGKREELGIRDTLLRSKEIASIEDGSPLVVAALHRFLLAVLYRALEGPTDIEQAKALFKTGFPADKIEAYLKKWRDRFWLFDEKYPFSQIPTFKTKKWRAWTALAVENNADTAKVLFDHTNDIEPGSITPANATRWLLATQTFAVSTGKSEISHTGTAPSAGSIMAIPIGKDLQDTLHFCLIPQNRESKMHDIPLWEKEPDSLKYLQTKLKVPGKKPGEDKDRAIERGATGLADLYTWRTRSVVFKEPSSGFISKLGFASGVGYKESLESDPMLGYTIKEVADKETKIKIKKKFPIQFEETGLWRDFDSLLPDDSHLAPKVIEHAVTLVRGDRNRFPWGVMVLGQKYFPPRPNVAFWRKEYFVLPSALIGEQQVRSDIRKMLDMAEDAQISLWSSCAAYADNLLARGDRKPAKQDVADFIEQMPCIPWYWSCLETKFHGVLQAYTLDKNFEEIELSWLELVHNSLRDAWSQHKASASTKDAWTIRALVKAERPIIRKLKALDSKISEYKAYMGKEAA